MDNTCTDDRDQGVDEGGRRAGAVGGLPLGTESKGLEVAGVALVLVFAIPSPSTASPGSALSSDHLRPRPGHSRSPGSMRRGQYDHLVQVVEQPIRTQAVTRGLPGAAGVAQLSARRSTPPHLVRPGVLEQHPVRGPHVVLVVSDGSGMRSSALSTSRVRPRLGISFPG